MTGLNRGYLWAGTGKRICTQTCYAKKRTKCITCKVTARSQQIRGQRGLKVRVQTTHTLSLTLSYTHTQTQHEVFGEL